MQVLVLVMVPEPQVTEQEPSTQSDQPPFTSKDTGTGFSIKMYHIIFLKKVC